MNLPTQYDVILNSGYGSDNGQFIEVQTNAAFDDISSCYSQLQNATALIIANAIIGSMCPYPHSHKARARPPGGGHPVSPHTTRNVGTSTSRCAG
jgi:hypothetical protein